MSKKKTPYRPRPPAPFYVIYGMTSNPQILEDPRIAALEPPCIVAQIENGRVWDEVVAPATQNVKGCPPSTRHESKEDAEKALAEFRCGKGRSLPVCGDREAPGVDPKRVKLN